MPTLEGFADLITWFDESGTEHFLNADVAVSADDTRSGTLTTHPVESGADVADHYVHDPDTFTISVAQTQTPIFSDDRFFNQTKTLKFKPSTPRGVVALAIGAVGGLITGKKSGEIKISVLATGSPIDRVADIHDQFIEIKQKTLPININFKGRRYEQFILISVKLSHQKGEFGLGRFELKAQQFNTVATETAELPDPTTLHAKPNKDGGKKATKPEDAGALTSVAKSLTNGIGLTTGGSGI